ncbi:response regulator [Pseudomonas sp. 39004]|jgi:signal transduction histidine kinase|uniref:response regulator n=1 Tax=Pseudomonas sp. 39004 TaxID=2967213 RepID=UPI002364A337|nr:response regulator [Pseudomonas sp. 39004]MDD1962977.1 response regulator [Pseudomonas sp. 39004]
MNLLQQRDAHTPPLHFLLNGGTIGGLLQSMDWSSSPLGPPEHWSPHLQAVMATLLPAQAQFVLFWGETYVALYNDAYAPTIGTKHPQALGRPAEDNWRELWDDLEPLLRGVRETGQTFSAKDRPFYIERRGLGETVYFDVSYSAVREADGSVGGVLCLVTETTERVRFQQRQAFLLELGRTLPGLGEAERIEAYVVARLAQHLGATQVCFGEDLGDGTGYKVAHDWADGLPSRVGQHRYATYGASLREQLAAGKVVQQAYDSASAPLSGLCSTLHVPVLRAGRLEAMLAVHFHTPHHCFEDECQLVEDAAKQAWAAITHARAERALHLLNESLEERVAAVLAEREAAILQLHEAHKLEMIGQLTGGIAHDLNNMLTPIIASFELMRRHPQSERAPRLIDGGLQAAERARNLVGRLLSFARRQTLKPQAVSLAALVEDMRELMARSLGPTIAVQVQVDPLLPAVLVDPHQLELALLNLVVNARDAMAGGGALSIVAGLDADGPPNPMGMTAAPLAWLQVRDSGSGMSDEQLRRCIEPFYSTKGVGKGTGLGLPMVQGLAVQSGGGFAIRSQQGEGTVATLWLPISDVAAVGRDSDSAEAPLADRASRILLVDDEEIVRHATALQLRDLGYEVCEASSAAAALQRVEQGWQPDVLVTDHVMADMTGVRFAQQMRERQADLPVLIITGYANLTPRELKGFEVLRKPYRRAELAQSVARLLAAPR